MEKQLKFLRFECVGWGKHRVGTEAVGKLPDPVTSMDPCVINLEWGGEGGSPLLRENFLLVCVKNFCSFQNIQEMNCLLVLLD